MNQSARKSRLYKKRNPQKKFPVLRLLTLLILCFLVFVIGFVIFGPHLWDGSSRLSLAIEKKNGDVIVKTYDPQAGSITIIDIPGNTEVSASRNLGIWKLSSIWKLGENEKVGGGSFLAATITKSFRFPIEGWGEEEMLRKTNLHLKDKIALALFSSNVRKTATVDLKLKDTDYLIPTKLADGTSGFKITQNIPIKISSIFTDTSISKRKVNVVIVDRMPDNVISSKVGEIIEVLGAKIATIDRQTPDFSDCIVRGESKTARKIGNLFNCKVKDEALGQKEDVEIILGKSFQKRF